MRISCRLTLTVEHGMCKPTDPPTCKCNIGFQPPNYCNQFTCDFLSNCHTPKGVCTYTEGDTLPTCICKSKINIIPPLFNVHCTHPPPESPQGDTLWTGQDCGTPVCPNACSSPSQGTCVDSPDGSSAPPQCQCVTPYIGNVTLSLCLISAAPFPRSPTYSSTGLQPTSRLQNHPW
jgi:hypothetical protein